MVSHESCRFFLYSFPLTALSCLFVKRREQLIDALSINPAYLRNAASDSGAVIDYRHWQVPLSRRFRALKIWFVIRTYGANGLKKYIRKHIELGRGFAEKIATKSLIFDIVTPPAFALTVIRVKSASGNLTESNRLTQAVYDMITKANEVMLTSTISGGYFVIRVVGANPNTEQKSYQKAFDVLVSAAEKVLSENSTIPGKSSVEPVSSGEMSGYEIVEDALHGKKRELRENSTSALNVQDTVPFWKGFLKIFLIE